MCIMHPSCEEIGSKMGGGCLIFLLSDTPEPDSPCGREAEVGLD